MSRPGPNNALHGTRHIPTYKKMVEDPLDAIRTAYEAGTYGKRGTDAVIKAAREAVEKVQEDIRKGLLDGTIKLQHYDTVANRQKWLQDGAVAIMAVAIGAAGMSEAEAEEVAMANIERMVEQESYYRQKNVIVRYGQAGYYTKDSNSKVARWTAFAVDFFNPIDDVVTITDLLEDAGKFAVRTGIEELHIIEEVVGGSVRDIVQSIKTIQSEPTSLWRMGRSAGVYRPARQTLRDILGL